MNYPKFKKSFYNVGLILIVVGSIIGLTTHGKPHIFAYYLISIGIPVYGIGTILIILSDKTYFLRTFTIGSPVLFLIPLNALVVEIYQDVVPETLLIPANFTGKFRVVYGQKCGMEPIIENGRRILIIPDNAILIIKPEYNEKSMDKEAYLVQKDGTRRIIGSTNEQMDIKKDEPFIYCTNIATVAGQVRKNLFSTSPNYGYTYMEYEVSFRDTSSIKYNQIEPYLNSLTDLEVKNCKGLKK